MALPRLLVRTLTQQFPPTVIRTQLHLIAISSGMQRRACLSLVRS